MSNTETLSKNILYSRNYATLPIEKKRITIKNWLRRGLKIDDVDALYDQYLQVSNCDHCGVLFGERGNGSGTFKTMDHCHLTGKFRNYLCNYCNTNVFRVCYRCGY